MPEHVLLVAGYALHGLLADQISQRELVERFGYVF
jgi:hypothetical protein